MPTRKLVTRYEDDLSLFPDRWHRIALAAGAAFLILLPLVADNQWLTVANLALVTIVGAIGLMILTGFTGQISLGHAAFLAVGAYTAAVSSSRFGLPFWLILPLAGALAAAVGLAIAALTAWFGVNLRRSNTGRAMAAVRDHALAASVMGVPLATYKIIAFGLSSFLGGVAGAMFGFQQQFITIDPPFNLTMSIEYIAAIVIGGGWARCSGPSPAPSCSRSSSPHRSCSRPRCR